MRGVKPMRDQPPHGEVPLQERDARLFDSAWPWLTAGLLVAVVVAIIAITASILSGSAPDVAPLAMRPPADDPANPPAAAAPNTPRKAGDIVQ